MNAFVNLFIDILMMDYSEGKTPIIFVGMGTH